MVTVGGAAAVPVPAILITRVSMPSFPAESFARAEIAKFPSDHIEIGVKKFQLVNPEAGIQKSEKVHANPFHRSPVVCFVMRTSTMVTPLLSLDVPPIETMSADVR